MRPNTLYTYDPAGRIERVTQMLAGASALHAFGYDADGNRTRIVYPSGRIVDYAFDLASRPVAATTVGTPMVLSATYLPFGPLRVVEEENTESGWSLATARPARRPTIHGTVPSRTRSPDRSFRARPSRQRG